MSELSEERSGVAGEKSYICLSGVKISGKMNSMNTLIQSSKVKIRIKGGLNKNKNNKCNLHIF